MICVIGRFRCEWNDKGSRAADSQTKCVSFVWKSDIVVILSTYQNTTFKYNVCVLCAYFVYIMRSHFHYNVVFPPTRIRMPDCWAPKCWLERPQQTIIIKGHHMLGMKNVNWLPTLGDPKMLQHLWYVLRIAATLNVLLFDLYKYHPSYRVFTYRYTFICSIEGAWLIIGDTTVGQSNLRSLANYAHSCHMLYMYICWDNRRLNCRQRSRFPNKMCIFCLKIRHCRNTFDLSKYNIQI